MKRSTVPQLLAACAIGVMGMMGCVTRTAVAGDHCFYRGTMYSDGAAACQSGSQYRCDDGEWKAAGIACSPPAEVTASRTCQFGGITFATGAASCQGGNQFRCEDGAWHSLGMTCALGDSPIRVSPSGRTCMYEGATVANGSTICRSGSTFFCNDGEWTNLGTLCR